MPMHGIESEQSDSSFKLSKYLLFLRRYWWLPLATTAIAVGIAAAYVHWKAPSYRSIASMWETEKLMVPGGVAFAEDPQSYIGTQLELMRSGKLAGDTLDRLKDLKSDAFPLLQDGKPIPVVINIHPVPKSTIFEVDATSPNAAYSQAYLNALLASYLDYKKNLRKLLSGDTLASISQQMDHNARELKDDQDLLTAYERTNNLAILQEEGTVAGGYLAKLQTELSDFQMQSQLIDKAEAAQGQSFGKGTNAAIDLNSANWQLNSANPVAMADQLTPVEEIDLLKTQRAELSKVLRPKHPKIVKLDEEILRYQRIAEIFHSEKQQNFDESRRAIKAKMANIVPAIETWEAKVAEADRRIAEADRLKLNVTRAQAVYDRMVQLLQNVDMSRNLDHETLAILEPASQGFRSYKKDMNLVEGSGVCGLCLGLGFVFLISVKDDRFNSLADVNEKYGDLIVGQVPDLPSHYGIQTPLMVLDDGRHIYDESFRNLRSAIFYMPAAGDRPKILLVTSALPTEGKSTVVTNLARTLAQGGSKVLLIDADLRKGNLHNVLDLKSEPGMVDLLKGNSGLDDVLQSTSTPNLFFLARGHSNSNPGDLFLNPKLDGFIQSLRGQFDYVLIDTCPVFAADDVATLAPRADGTLFIVRNGFSSASIVRSALELLFQRQVKVLGLVFNRADSSSRSYHHYKYSEYHHQQSARN